MQKYISGVFIALGDYGRVILKWNDASETQSNLKQVQSSNFERIEEHLALPNSKHNFYILREFVSNLKEGYCSKFKLVYQNLPYSNIIQMEAEKYQPHVPDSSGSCRWELPSHIPNVNGKGWINVGVKGDVFPRMQEIRG